MRSAIIILVSLSVLTILVPPLSAVNGIMAILLIIYALVKNQDLVLNSILLGVILIIMVVSVFLLEIVYAGGNNVLKTLADNLNINLDVLKY